MISIDQADYFITNHLKIRDWKLILNNDKVEFLRQVTKSHVINIYFQGISIAAEEESKRTKPTLQNIIDIGLEGKGGCCLHLNYFIHLLLKALGFDTFVSAASWSHSPFIGSHCVAIVVLSDAEKYLIDVGAGIPNYEIIPLHQLPYRGIGGGIPFEFRYLEKDDLYQRFQLKGRFFKGDFENGKTEELKYSFNLQPNKLEDFDNNMQILFTDQTRSFFLRNTFMFRHFEEQDKIKFVIIWGLGIVEGDDETRCVTNYKNYKELGPAIKKYFPDINVAELKNALKCFEDFDASNYPYA